jgi:ribosome recycling factor
MALEVKKSAEDRMDKAVGTLKRELASLRAGKASASLLDRITAEYYGAATPLNQLANISTPDSRTILIQPWDKGALQDIEKAIMKSDVGLTPSNDGMIIRLVVPMLTEERRLELVKVAKKLAEESKVAIRNIRRDANDSIKKLEKTEISEDESKRYQDDVQKLTDKYIAESDKVLAAKEKEILEV